MIIITIIAIELKKALKNWIFSCPKVIKMYNKKFLIL